MSRTFTTWLRRQARRDDPVGDLSSDVERDPLARGVRSIPKLRLRLLCAGACSGALDALDQALEEWRSVGGAQS
jgi:hypothetical protein